MRQPKDVDIGLPLELVREYLSYDPESGDLKWLKSKSGPHANVGDIAGRLRPDGYRIVCFCQNMILAHRLAWFIHYGKWPSTGIDHINGDPSDNRLCNLREADPSQNHGNMKISARNTSGSRGVWLDRRRGRYSVELMVRGKKIHLGSYKSIEEATSVQRNAMDKHFGEFSRRNQQEAH